MLLVSSSAITSSGLQPLPQKPRIGPHGLIRAFRQPSGIAGCRRQRNLYCQAQDRSSATTDIRKVDTEKGGILHSLWETVFTPESLVPLGIGVGGGILAGYGQDGALIGMQLPQAAFQPVSATGALLHSPCYWLQTVAGAAAGAALRAAQLLFLQQTVPFTYRKHTLILPVGIELLMGDATFKQQIGGYAQAGKLLKENNSDYQLIQGIAKRVIQAVSKEYGGGFQKHVSKFKWEVVVVDDKVPNAFVLPGGKIVVFTGEYLTCSVSMLCGWKRRKCCWMKTI